MADKKLQIIPLGGLGEFGMNCMAVRYGDDIIVLDAGMMFPDAELLGVDIVTPDFTYLEQNKEHVRGLVLTHGHEDHIGGIPFLLAQMNIPVYGTAFTLALVERRLEEHQMLDSAKLHKVKPGGKLTLGPFSIEFIHVTHSIVSCVLLAITTPLGVIIHTGDYKVDPTPTDNELFDLHTLADYGKRGVLLLLSDSTNSDRPGYTESERAVKPRMEEIFSRSESRIVVACFSSSIHRIQLVLDLAQEYGRRVAVIGRSMVSVTEIAHAHGLLSIPDGILLRPQDAMTLPPDKVAILIGAGPKFDRSARHHRVTGVEYQIGKDLLQLAAARVYGRQPVTVLLDDLAIRFSELRLKKLKSVVEEFIDIRLDKLLCITGSGEVEQIPDDIRGSVCLTLHLLQERMLRIGLGNHSEKHLRV